MNISEQIQQLNTAKKLREQGEPVRALEVLVDRNFRQPQCDSCGCELLYAGQEHDCKYEHGE